MADREVTAHGALYQCKSCERHLRADEFYSSNQSRCKECVKTSVKKNRDEKAEYYRSYDRLRYRQNPERKAHCHRAGKTTPMSVRVEKQRERRRREPEKNKARLAVSRALSKGTLVRPNGCYFCEKQEKLQAHHVDYSRPLDVFWLCTACHGKIHALTGDFLRGAVGVQP